MRPVNGDKDVGVVGGGPAGSSLATLLALRGHSVVLIDRAAFPRPQIGESLPPKVEPLLSILDVSEQIDALGFARMRGTTLSQGAEIETHDFHPEGLRRGFQVDRAQFDRALLTRARDAGVVVLEDASFRDILYEGERIAGMTFEHAGHEAQIKTRFLVDASGSAAVVSRALGVKRRDAIRTVALCGYWKETRVPDSFPANNTLFEMLPDGWIWSVLRADGLRNVTLGVDPSTIKTAGQPNVELYLDHVRDSKLVGPLLERAQLSSMVTIHDATWSAAEQYAGEGFLLVGDAASVIDPLTSQGVYKALQSGIVGAAVLNTCLTRPQDTDMAIAYYQHAQEEFQQNYAEIAQSFYRGSPFLEEEFWAVRTRADELSSSGILDARISEQNELREAFFKTVGEAGGRVVRLKRSDDLALSDRPMAEGGFIVRKPALTSASQYGFASWVDTGRADPTLLYELLDGRPMTDLFETYVERTQQPRSVELGRTLHMALANLAARRLIEVET